MQNSTCKQYDIRVSGRVQGVGFRYSTRNKARELGLRGWVRNLPDGSVRIAVQGDQESCHAFLAWCRSNPGYSWVEKIDHTEVAVEALAGFTILY